jgi:hypothetical protein
MKYSEEAHATLFSFAVGQHTLLVGHYSEHRHIPLVSSGTTSVVQVGQDN